MTRDDTDTGARRPKTAKARVERTDLAPLSNVERAETVADGVDLARIEAELPDEWTVKPDIVQTGPEPLAETLLFRRSITEPQLVLRPADPAHPRREIECYERSGPQAKSRRTMTVETLSEAVRVAVNRIHQFEG